MSKQSDKKKTPKDINEIAFHIVKETTEKSESSEINDKSITRRGRRSQLRQKS